MGAYAPREGDPYPPSEVPGEPRPFSHGETEGGRRRQEPIRKGETEGGGKRLSRIQEFLVQATDRIYPHADALEHFHKAALKILHQLGVRAEKGKLHGYASRIVHELPQIRWSRRGSDFWVGPELVVCHESDRDNWLTPVASDEEKLQRLQEVPRIVAYAFLGAGLKPRVVTFVSKAGQPPGGDYLRILVLQGVCGEDRFVAYLRFRNY